MRALRDAIINPDIPPIQAHAVKRLNRACSIFNSLHRNKPKSSRAVSLTLVVDDSNRLDRAIGREERVQV